MVGGDCVGFVGCYCGYGYFLWLLDYWLGGGGVCVVVVVLMVFGFFVRICGWGYCEVRRLCCGVLVR